MSASEYFAQNLIRLQSERHLTCTEFAAELGVSKSTLYNLRQGSGRFSSATLDQIAGALALPPAALLSGEDNVRRICESVIHTSEAVGKLSGRNRERALYYLGQLMALIT